MTSKGYIDVFKEQPGPVKRYKEVSRISEGLNRTNNGYIVVFKD